MNKKRERSIQVHTSIGKCFCSLGSNTCEHLLMKNKLLKFHYFSSDASLLRVISSVRYLVK